MAAKSPDRRRTAATIAAIERHHGPCDPRLVDLRRTAAVDSAAETLSQIIESAPPLRPEDVERLRALLPATQDGGEQDAA